MPSRFPYTINVASAGLYRIELLNASTGNPATPAASVTISLNAGQSHSGSLVSGVAGGAYAVRAKRLDNQMGTTATARVSACGNCSPLWVTASGQGLICKGGACNPVFVAVGDLLCAGSGGVGTNPPCPPNWTTSEALMCVEL